MTAAHHPRGTYEARTDPVHPFFVEDRSIRLDDLARGRSAGLLVLVYFGSLVLAVPTDVPWPGDNAHWSGPTGSGSSRWPYSLLARRPRWPSCAGTPIWCSAVLLGDPRFRLVTRALPMLLLFTTFLLIMLVLLVTQLAQVVLLAVAVWLFFLAFGAVAIEDDVVRSWVVEGAPYPVPAVGLLSRELLQVSVFLAAFSGLYFTVYAITDSTYREQFFTEITDELEQAVGVRTAYLALRRQQRPA